MQFGFSLEEVIVSEVEGISGFTGIVQKPNSPVGLVKIRTAQIKAAQRTLQFAPALTQFR
jgi:hypothetical protein